MAHLARRTQLQITRLALDAAALVIWWRVAVPLREFVAAYSPSLAPLPAESVLHLGWLVVPLFMLVLWARGRAPQSRANASHSALVVSVALATAGTLSLLFLAAIDVNRTLVVGFSLGAVPVLTVSRWLAALLIRAFPPRARNLLVVGEAADAKPVIRVVARHPEWGLRVAYRIGPDELDVLPGLLAGQPIDELHFATNLAPEQMEPVCHLADELGVILSLDAHFLGHRSHKAELVDWDGWSVLSFAGPADRAERVVKRALDLSLTLLLLVPGLPLLALLTVLIWLSDGGTPWFTAQRVGQYGRPFRMYKLRTMVPDAHALWVGVDPATGRKPLIDPRVTPLGKLLRRFSLDELPQLLNVVQGDMSLVGPRPPLSAEVERYERWQMRRLSVPPGMTGAWQVAGRADLPLEEWMRLDLQYIDEWSLWLDFKLLVETLPAVLRGTGAR